MSLNVQIADIIEPTLDDMGYSLVRISITGNTTQVVQIMAERKDEKPMQVGDCAEISHAVSALMDVEDPIAGAYSLEVSSPGIDRPLVKAKDFERFTGFEAKIETIMPNETGQKRFKGRLKNFDAENQTVTIEYDGKTFETALDNIDKAKLVLTDELIEAMTQKEG